MLGKWVYITKDEWDDSNKVGCSRCGYIIEHMDKRLDYCPECNAYMQSDKKYFTPLSEYYNRKGDQK